MSAWSSIPWLPPLVAMVAGVILAAILRRFRVPGAGSIGGAVAGWLAAATWGPFASSMAGLADVRWWLLVAPAVLLLGASPRDDAAGRRHDGAARRDDGAARRDDGGARLGEGVLIGLWAAVVPALGTLVVARWCGVPPFSAPALAAAAALAAGPIRVSARDMVAASRIDPGGGELVRIAARTALSVAVLLGGVAAGVAISSGGDPWTAFLPWALAAASIAIGPVVLRRGPGLGPVVIERTALPALAALLAGAIDLGADAAWLPLLGLALLAGDGRWLGGFIGSAFQRHRRVRSARLVMPLIAAAPAQVAILALAAASVPLPGWLRFALLGSAIVVDALAPLRTAADRHLEELERLGDDDRST